LTALPKKNFPVNSDEMILQSSWKAAGAVIKSDLEAQSVLPAQPADSSAIQNVQVPNLNMLNSLLISENASVIGTAPLERLREK
jgi:hypothetical protein